MNLWSSTERFTQERQILNNVFTATVALADSIQKIDQLATAIADANQFLTAVANLVAAAGK